VFVRSIIREVHILRKLTQLKQNKFTVKLLDAFIGKNKDKETDELKTIYLVMDYFAFDIRAMINSTSANLQAEHIKILAYNLLCALKFLHSANLFHRDIKPGNILVTPHCTIKVCDFGLARTIKDSSAGIFDDFEESKNKEFEESKSKKNSQMKYRPMSPVCFSRWYRPPEVIL